MADTAQFPEVRARNVARGIVVDEASFLDVQLAASLFVECSFGTRQNCHPPPGFSL